MSLTAKTTTGVLWNLLEQLARRGVSILVTLLLARFLVPEDFGLVAMMAVFLGLGQTLTDSGFREALIRLQHVNQEHYSTAFFANLVLGFISYSVLFVTAPIIAEFYEDSRLVDLIRVSALSVVVMSFQVVQVASLSRKLNFKAQLKASFPAGFISGVVAVGLAWLGAGVWALVAQMLLNAIIHTSLLWVSGKWRPSWQFSWRIVREMYDFGYKLFLSGLIDTIFQNLYVIVIAKIFSASLAGLYFFAHKLKELFVQLLVTSIQKVTYPALASIQQDNALLKQSYKRIIVLMSMLLFPAFLFVAVIAKPAFELLLPPQWLQAVPYFQLLCVATVLLPLHSVNLNILKVKGRSELYLYLEIVKKSVNALTLLLTYRYGIYAILVGQIATSVISYIPNSYFSSALLKYGPKEQVKDCIPALVIALICSAVGYVIVEKIQVHPVFLIFLVGLTMAIMYVALSFVFNRKSFDVVSVYMAVHLFKKRIV